MDKNLSTAKILGQIAVSDENSLPWKNEKLVDQFFSTPS